MIIVKDSANSETYDILHEVRVETYERAAKALDTKEGVVTDAVTFSFVPDVGIST